MAAGVAKEPDAWPGEQLADTWPRVAALERPTRSLCRRVSWLAVVKDTLQSRVIMEFLLTSQLGSFTGRNLGMVTSLCDAINYNVISLS